VGRSLFPHDACRELVHEFVAREVEPDLGEQARHLSSQELPPRRRLAPRRGTEPGSGTKLPRNDLPGRTLQMRGEQAFSHQSICRDDQSHCL
jgi:hypothetical protein